MLLEEMESENFENGETRSSGKERSKTCANKNIFVSERNYSLMTCESTISLIVLRLENKYILVY